MLESVIEAIQAGDAATLQELLVADPALAAGRTKDGVSLLLLALYHRQPECAARLREAKPSLDHFEAAALGDCDRLAELLDATAELPDAVSTDGFTPLHLAAFFGGEATAALLLERGADSDAIATNGSRLRPLHSAAAARSSTIVQALLDNGADPNAQQEGGFTALHAAAMQGERAIAEALLAGGADRAVPTDDGKTALNLARDNDQSELATLLDS